MNLFRTGTISKSVRDLDDKRLAKQIIECKTIINVSEGAKGYANHPVVKYYAKYPQWVVHYALACCEEYEYRFNKQHSLKDFFCSRYQAFCKLPKVFYCEGSITSPEAIRCYSTIKSIKLFKQKLCNKWYNDLENDRRARWTKRKTPKFYKAF